MTGKHSIVVDRRSRPIDRHAYTVPVVREIPPDPPDPPGTQWLW
jgi:hypothetical protein